MDDEKLLKYFIEQTNEKLAAMGEKLDDLTKFKIEMMASARTTAFIISGVCGIITFVASIAVAVYTGGVIH